jgi:predicted nucleic acid-binding protein
VGLLNDVGHGPVAVDTVALIYYIEEKLPYLETLDPLFEAVDLGHLEVITSCVTLHEVLVHPYRHEQHLLAEKYERILRESSGDRSRRANARAMAARGRASSSIPKTEDT